MQNIYAVLTAAERAAVRANVNELKKLKLDAMKIASNSTGPFYLRALNVKRYIDNLILDLGF